MALFQQTLHTILQCEYYWRQRGLKDIITPLVADILAKNYYDSDWVNVALLVRPQLFLQMVKKPPFLSLTTVEVDWFIANIIYQRSWPLDRLLALFPRLDWAQLQRSLNASVEMHHLTAFGHLAKGQPITRVYSVIVEQPLERWPELFGTLPHFGQITALQSLLNSGVGHWVTMGWQMLANNLASWPPDFRINLLIMLHKQPIHITPGRQTSKLIKQVENLLKGAAGSLEAWFHKQQLDLPTLHAILASQDQLSAIIIGQAYIRAHF